MGTAYAIQKYAKYANLAYWLFSAEGNWEETDIRQVLCPHPESRTYILKVPSNILLEGQELIIEITLDAYQPGDGTRGIYRKTLLKLALFLH